MRKHVLFLLVLLIFSLASANQPSGSFVGRISDSDAFIAIVANNEGRVLAYLCDSQTIAEWFRGEVAEAGIIDLQTESGAGLWAQFVGEEAWGAVTVGGETLSFTAERVPEGSEAGLYRAEGTKDGAEYVGGWIVLPSGEQRGALKITDGTSNTFADGSVRASSLNTTSGTAEAEGFGSFETKFIDPTGDI